MPGFDASSFRIRDWRSTLLAAAAALLLVLALLMKWLVELQVEAAEARRADEAAARKAQARCFALPSRAQQDACRNAGGARLPNPG